MRFFGTLGVVAVIAGVASADIPIPPLGKDEKEVKISKEVQLGKDMTGFVFFQNWEYGGKDSRAPEPNVVYKKIELSAKKATVLSNGGSLHAVREEDAKKFKTDEELNAALVKGTLKPIYTDIGGGYTMRVKKADIDDDSLTLTYTITGIDDKGKATVKREGKHADLFTEDGFWKPKKKGEPKKSISLAEPGYLIGGVALAVGITLGGLWLVRRNNVPKMKA